MIQLRRPSRARAPETGGGTANRLPYAIELWNVRRTAPERVIARAANVALAQAIFKAAQAEHPGRRIVLRRGDRVLMEMN